MTKLQPLPDMPSIVPLRAEENGAPPAAIPMPAPRSVFLGGLFILALLAGCYVAAEIVLPIVLAFMLKLVFQPVMRVLTRLRLPRSIAALLIIILLVGGLFAVGSALSAPASDWAKRLSGSWPMLKQRLSVITEPMVTMQGVLSHADGLTTAAGPKPVTVAVEGSRLSDRLMTDTRSFVAGTFQTVLVVFFLLTAGDTFLRRLVETLPRFRDKRQAVEISQKIESDISVYLATITLMNGLVGFATGGMMALCRVEDPILWGVTAFLLNYVPIMGPLICGVVFAVVGLLTKDGLLPALLPAGLYLLIHLAESAFITPHFLARRFTLNPVLVILSLIFWYWMWGVPGAILSVPMLAIAKIVCDQIPSLKPVGHFFEGDPHNEAPAAAPPPA